MTEQWQTKRFVLMGGPVYYASGGFEDYLGSFDTKEEAEAKQKEWLDENQDYTWSHIADLSTGKYWTKGRAHNIFRGM